MSDAQGQSAAAWRQLEGEWADARELWHDGTTTFFARHYWQPLETEAEGHQRALEALMETLRAAQEAARI